MSKRRLRGRGRGDENERGRRRVHADTEEETKRRRHDLVVMKGNFEFMVQYEGNQFYIL